MTCGLNPTSSIKREPGRGPWRNLRPAFDERSCLLEIQVPLEDSEAAGPECRTRVDVRAMLEENIDQREILLRLVDSRRIVVEARFIDPRPNGGMLGQQIPGPCGVAFANRDVAEHLSLMCSAKPCPGTAIGDQPFGILYSAMPALQTLSASCKSYRETTPACVNRMTSSFVFTSLTLLNNVTMGMKLRARGLERE